MVYDALFLDIVDNRSTEVHWDDYSGGELRACTEGMERPWLGDRRDVVGAGALARDDVRGANPAAIDSHFGDLAAMVD